MPTFVVDTNAISAEALRSFLSTSSNHIVVLCPFVLMETLKSADKVNVVEDLRVLRDFPSQVAITKEAYDIAATRGTAESMPELLLNRELSGWLNDNLGGMTAVQPASLPNDWSLTPMVAALARAKVGEIGSRAAKIQQTHVRLAEEISKEDLRAWRKGNSCSEEFWRLFVQRCHDLCAYMLQGEAAAGRMPTIEELPHTFAYRHSVLANCYFLDWLRFGSPTNSSSKKIGNDLIDLRIGALATFFDGLITNDEKLERVFGLANGVLSDITPSNKVNSDH